MTVEQKAKAYDEALERAKKEWSNNLDGAYKNYRERLEFIFPEVKKNKKEWIEVIRQELKSYLNHREVKQISESDAILQWFAWLEKQGKQESIDPDTLIQQRVDTLADIDAKQSSADNVKPKVKNDIEIPFGAKDSELQEATYFIPKGFHAEIDDDKVVIKKGEKPAEWSEDDERIKKRLINLVNEIYNNTNYITFLEHKELLAWLEKLDDNVEL